MVEKLVLDHVLLRTLADQTNEHLTIAVGKSYGTKIARVVGRTFFVKKANCGTLPR